MANKKTAEKGKSRVVANCDNLRFLKFNPSLPYVFTESGIAPLSSVLHSERAIEISVKIMSAFVAMRYFIIQNAGILNRIMNLEHRQIETDEIIDQILDKKKSCRPSCSQRVIPTKASTTTQCCV